MRKTSAKKISTEPKEKILTGRVIDAMTDAQRAQLAAELNAQTPQERDAKVRSLNAEQRATRRRIRKKLGRPKIGKGSKAISLTVEKSLLGRATTFAKRHGIKRAELFARGLELAMSEG